jgi:hypothetical protein
MTAVNTAIRSQRKAALKKFGWRVCLAAALIAAGYGAWLLVPVVVKSDFAPHIETSLIALLGVTPLLSKLAALALFGKPIIDLVKRYALKFWQR